MDSRDVESHKYKDWFSFDEKKMLLVFEDDNENEIAIPAIFEVCGLCDGKGSHVNPSIDSNGITAEEWDDWDNEDRENYMNGGYDVPCYKCGGKRVIPGPDRDRAIPEHLEIWDENVEDMNSSAYDEYREREMGY